MILPRLALNIYMGLAMTLTLAAGLFLLILKFIFKRNIKIKHFIYIPGLPLSYVLASISIMGPGSAATFNMARDFIYICLLAMAYYLLFVSLYKLKSNRL